MKIVFLYKNGKKSSSFKDKDYQDLILNSWSSYIAKYMADFFHDIVFVNVRQDASVDKECLLNKSNFKTIIFPNENLNFFGVLNKSLLKELKIILDQGDAILHCFHTHSLISYYIVWKYRQFPIVLTNYGHTPPFYSSKPEKKISKKIKLWILSYLEKFVYRNVNLFTPSGVVERAYLKRTFPNMRVADFDHLGIDFNLFKPISKLEARTSLKLPKDANILLYVGHLYELKGVDAILDSYNKLKADNPHLILVLIGAAESDPLYKLALESGAKIYPRLSHDELKVYYSSADIYLLPNFKSKEFVKFGGIGTAPLEAMACNTPVISSHLIHFPVNDLKNVGIIPKDESDLSQCIKTILSNKQNYIHCSEIVRKYYDRKKIADSLIEEYKKVLHEM